MKTINKISLAIALFSLRIPAIWYVIFLYYLFQVVLLCFQVSIPFLSFNTVEAAGLSPEDLVRQKTIPQLSVDGESSNAKPNNLQVTVKLESDAATAVASASTGVTKVLENYFPIISGAAVASGTALITKGLPAKQRLAGMVIAGGITSGTMLASQYMNLIYKNKKVVDEVSKLDTKPDWNNTSDIQDIEISEPSFVINAPLEGYNDLSMMTLGIIIINGFMILGLLLILINYLILSLNLDSIKFITDRPYLLKFLKVSMKIRLYVTWFVYTFVLYGACSMFYFLCHLLEFIKDLGL